jgi:hypothetical protein
MQEFAADVKTHRVRCKKLIDALQDDPTLSNESCQRIVMEGRYSITESEKKTRMLEKIAKDWDDEMYILSTGEADYEAILTDTYKVYHPKVQDLRWLPDDPDNIL